MNSLSRFRFSNIRFLTHTSLHPSRIVPYPYKHFSTPSGKPKPVITKEQMKAEMLEHDYFDTEILYDGMMKKGQEKRREEEKKQEKDLLEDK